MRPKIAIGTSVLGHDARRAMFRLTSGENTLNRRCAPVTLVFAVLMALGWPESTAAQPIERPTDCTEEMAVGTIFIGHDCGEWASVLISGNVIIRKPWSRANRASRAVRLRERREGSPSRHRRPPFPTATLIPTLWMVLHPAMRETATGVGRRRLTSRSSFAARQRPSRPSSLITATRLSS